MIKSVFFQNKLAILLCIAFYTFIGSNAYSQDDKIGARLTVEHVKIVNENSFIKISAIFKGEEGFEPCQNLNFTMYKVEVNDEDEELTSEIKIGEALTNYDGKAKFIIPAEFISTTNDFIVRIEDSEIYEDDEESLTVTNANIEASIVEIDSVNHIQARLFTLDNKPIVEQDIKVGLKRLFGSLTVGEEDSYTTDEDGSILVPIQEGLTGIDGKLTFEIVLKESDDFGTIIAYINSDIGVPIKDESTFNQRTMWSPPTKTPLFLWIVPNIMLVGIWSILLFLVINLFKIYKSKI
ncbi:MAG: hypothetical protein COS19_07660 [Flavobacteriaceae bacterium CG02_land_8_20_14_3_00_34_13]|nr:MAG: hypothetical protein COS19_07660 [Flavobacteriaceae bacterium CG02_land_8_20_14_3_00_34_13]